MIIEGRVEKQSGLNPLKVYFVVHKVLRLQLRLLHWNLWMQSPQATSSCDLIPTYEREGGRGEGEREGRKEGRDR